MRTPRPAALALTIGVVAVAVVVPTGVGFAAYHHDQSSLRTLPKNAVVGGVDVSGLNRDAALSRVQAAVDSQLDRRATLVIGKHRYVTTPRQLGVHDNAAQAVDAAFQASRKGSWLSRSWHRAFGSHSTPTVSVALSQPSKTRLQAIVDRAVKENAVDPVDAEAYLSGGFVSFSQAKSGLKVDKAQALAALQASLRDGKPHEAPVKVVKPKVTDASLGTVILVHANANKLYLYKDGKIARTFTVATGTNQYPTPTGHFRITLKRFMPTWYNPHSPWSIHEPETIPPGAHNPLGLRALNVSAPGIRIHGSPADYSIGYNASHGCIRMHNSDVIQLFPLVPTGAQVFITRVGPYRPLVKKAVKKDDPKKPVPVADVADGG
jgi:lipoprotein-anchoring transpeptidase ErfK/SrfK